MTALDRLHGGLPLTTVQVSILLDCSAATVLRRFAKLGIAPATPAAGRRATRWHAADVRRLLGLEGSHAEA